MVGQPARPARRTYFWTLAFLRLRPFSRAVLQLGGVGCFSFFERKKMAPQKLEMLFLQRQNMLVKIFFPQNLQGLVC